MEVTPRRIEVTIEELVLHGLPAAQRHTIGDAVAREIERALATGGHDVAGVHDHSIGRVDGGSFTFAAGDARGAGRGIARAVLGALRGGGAP